LRPRDPRDSGEYGGARDQMQKSTAWKFHDLALSEIF
jgi:hypothetical protein